MGTEKKAAELAEELLEKHRLTRAQMAVIQGAPPCECDLCVICRRLLGLEQAHGATADAIAEEREACALLCEREGRACDGHARSYRESDNPTVSKGRITFSKAHEMAGNQNRACAHYIRDRANRYKRGGA